MPASAPDLRSRVMAALAATHDRDGVIVHGEGRVLAWRPPHPVDGGAVLVDLDHGDGSPAPSRQEPVRADVRRLPVQLDMPGVE